MTVKSLSSRGRKAHKPAKPRKDFPLWETMDVGCWARLLSVAAELSSHEKERSKLNS
jgi:hypothetical protein